LVKALISVNIPEAATCVTLPLVALGGEYFKEEPVRIISLGRAKPMKAGSVVEQNSHFLMNAIESS
jgi:hypothetical protein